MKDSYRNPFSGVNAGQLDANSIVEYWCNPFVYDLFSEIKEDDIYLDSNNIVFMGGRSTGKSMFLRYWSHSVQELVAEKNNQRFVDLIKEKKGLGFYFRIDGPVLRSFTGSGLTNEQWSPIFTHYFELIVARQYLEVLGKLVDKKQINEENVCNDFIPAICALINNENVTRIEDLISEFDQRIQEVDTFRGNVPFYRQPFQPSKKGFASQTLSFEVAEKIFELIGEFNEINFVILLDEYENFLDYQQVVLNTLLRFTRSKIKFRIGMRLEGFRTFSMIADEDFIKEGREYRKVVFEEVLNKSTQYQNFLQEICRKRLEAIPALKEKGFTDIKQILSEKEEWEEDVYELVKSSPDRIFNFFSKNKKIHQDQLLLVRYPANPLLELLNFIWLVRGKSPEIILKSMNDYLNKNETEDFIKYRRDYVDKYKLSLTILIYSIYRKNKPYYSFNTFSFLSSGIVGNFIELCRRSFAIAGWGDDDRLLGDGKISKEHQAKAALDLAIAEKQQVSRIEKYGGVLSKFIENIGNIFREFHRDFKIRYPETNQFSTNLDAIIDPSIKEAMRSALKWSIIQKKPKMQRTGPGEHIQDIFTLNRIFSPAFEISFRTRGGKSVLLDEIGIKEMMRSTMIDAEKYLPMDDTSSDKNSDNTLDLFTAL